MRCIDSTHHLAIVVVLVENSRSTACIRTISFRNNRFTLPRLVGVFMKVILFVLVINSGIAFGMDNGASEQLNARKVLLEKRYNLERDEDFALMTQATEDNREIENLIESLSTLSYVIPTDADIRNLNSLAEISQTVHNLADHFEEAEVSLITAKFSDNSKITSLCEGLATKIHLLIPALCNNEVLSLHAQDANGKAENITHMFAIQRNIDRITNAIGLDPIAVLSQDDQNVEQLGRAFVDLQEEWDAAERAAFQYEFQFFI